MYVDKGYDSKDNCKFLEKIIQYGVIRRVYDNKPLNRDDIESNKGLAKIRYSNGAEFCYFTPFILGVNGRAILI